MGPVAGPGHHEAGGLDRINRLYSDALAYEGPYPEGLLHAMDVRTEVDPREADRIPPEGPAIVIANHPTGALDGIVLIDWLSKRRPDARFMGNYLLSRIGPLKRYFISVDPFDAKAAGNVSGMREAMRHLSRGGLLVIFPAGEVATWRKGFRDIGDREWPRGVMRFIRRAEVPVIPLYIDARNSPLFRLAGKLHPMLRTALLPRELLNKKGVGVELRIGSAVLPRKTASLTETDYNGYLRASVEYFKPLDGRRRPPRAARRAARKVPDEVLGAVDVPLLEAELDLLRGGHRLFEYGSYEVYLAPPDRIPHMMIEIGSLRERTFREIGEGTKNAIDTDRFDSYYYQLFVWDREARRLVGAYRLGMGDRIMERYGLKGFYTNTLFRMKPAMGEVMGKTIELGRSFIVRDYQRKPVSLMLLWKGILYVLLRNGQFRYLLGPVTISGGFQSASKLIIASHIRDFYLDREKAGWIRPRTGIDIRVRIDENLIAGIRSIDLINRLVCDIEKNAYSIPVLIRKYLQLNSSVLGFNTDHEFCDSLDALMLLDLKKGSRGDDSDAVQGTGPTSTYWVDSSISSTEPSAESEDDRASVCRTFEAETFAFVCYDSRSQAARPGLILFRILSVGENFETEMRMH